MTIDQKCKLRLFIYFDCLTKTQQQKLSSLVPWHSMETLSIRDWYKITRKKSILDDIRRLKRESIRLVG